VYALIPRGTKGKNFPFTTFRELWELSFMPSRVGGMENCAEK
jgi:hypothetical protein